MLNDKVNDAYGFIYALTQFIAPLIGSSIYQIVGMRDTFDITALICFSFAVILMVFNCGLNYK